MLTATLKALGNMPKVAKNNVSSPAVHLRSLQGALAEQQIKDNEIAVAHQQYDDAIEELHAMKHTNEELHVRIRTQESQLAMLHELRDEALLLQQDLSQEQAAHAATEAELSAIRTAALVRVEDAMEEADLDRMAICFWARRRACAAFQSVRVWRRETMAGVRGERLVGRHRARLLQKTQRRVFARLGYFKLDVSKWEQAQHVVGLWVEKCVLEALGAIWTSWREMSVLNDRQRKATLVFSNATQKRAHNTWVVYSGAHADATRQAHAAAAKCSSISVLKGWARLVDRCRACRKMLAARSTMQRGKAMRCAACARRSSPSQCCQPALLPCDLRATAGVSSVRATCANACHVPLPSGHFPLLIAMPTVEPHSSRSCSLSHRCLRHWTQASKAQRDRDCHRRFALSCMAPELRSCRAAFNSLKRLLDLFQRIARVGARVNGGVQLRALNNWKVMSRSHDQARGSLEWAVGASANRACRLALSAWMCTVEQKATLTRILGVACSSWGGANVLKAWHKLLGSYHRALQMRAALRSMRLRKARSCLNEWKGASAARVAMKRRRRGALVTMMPRTRQLRAAFLSMYTAKEGHDRIRTLATGLLHHRERKALTHWAANALGKHAWQRCLRQGLDAFGADSRRPLRKAILRWQREREWRRRQSQTTYIRRWAVKRRMGQWAASTRERLQHLGEAIEPVRRMLRSLFVRWARKRVRAQFKRRVEEGVAGRLGALVLSELRASAAAWAPELAKEEAEVHRLGGLLSKRAREISEMRNALQASEEQSAADRAEVARAMEGRDETIRTLLFSRHPIRQVSAAPNAELPTSPTGMSALSGSLHVTTLNSPLFSSRAPPARARSRSRQAGRAIWWPAGGAVDEMVTRAATSPRVAGRDPRGSPPTSA